MKILVACEFSGIVRDAFRKRGHDAWSCDILPTEADPAYHIQGDVLEILDDGWDMMIAHPPCTYLSNAGAVFLYPKGCLNHNRLAKGMEAKLLFMKLWNADISKIAIENPVPSTVYELPQYSQTIQPYQFGHQLQKKTCLWLKNLPLLVPTNIVENAQSTKIAGNWFNKGGKDRQKKQG
jgi:hypothetical protein